MTIDTLQEILGRRPFEPFRVVTSSRERYDIRHPENAVLLRNGLIVAYGSTNGSLPEHFAALSLLHITAVKRIPTGRRTVGVPRRRRRR
jgi:hypothetical protein